MAAAPATLGLRDAIIAIISFIAAFLGAYAKKKMENLADHENLKDLVTQMKAITQDTKTIEGAISDKAWDRQKQWELKRDFLFAAVESLGRANEELISLATTYASARAEGPQAADEWRKLKLEGSQAWRAEMNRYDEKWQIAPLVCRKETVDALRHASQELRSGAAKIFKDEVNAYLEIMPPIQQTINTVFSVARSELGIDSAPGLSESIPQSSRS